MNDKCNPTPFRTSKKGLKAEQKKRHVMKSHCGKTGSISKNLTLMSCVDLLLESRFVIKLLKKRSFLLSSRLEMVIKCRDSEISFYSWSIWITTSTCLTAALAKTLLCLHPKSLTNTTGPEFR